MFQFEISLNLDFNLSIRFKFERERLCEAPIKNPLTESMGDANTAVSSHKFWGTKTKPKIFLYQTNFVSKLQ